MPSSFSFESGGGEMEGEMWSEGGGKEMRSEGGGGEMGSEGGGGGLKEEEERVKKRR